MLQTRILSKGHISGGPLLNRTIRSNNRLIFSFNHPPPQRPAARLSLFSSSNCCNTYISTNTNTNTTRLSTGVRSFSSSTKRQSQQSTSTSTIHTTNTSNSNSNNMSAQMAGGDVRYLADENPPYCSMNIKHSWEKLTEREKLYAHWMSQACWSGYPIISETWSSYSLPILTFILNLFRSINDPNKLADLDAWKKRASFMGVGEKEWNEVVVYCSMVLSNLSQYRSFGMSKFTPRCHRDIFEAVIATSEGGWEGEAGRGWVDVRDPIYALSPEGHLHIGKPSAGNVSNYYPDSPDITDDEVRRVQVVLDKNGVGVENTRLKKKSSTEFVLLVASSSTTPDPRSPLKDTTVSPPLTIHLQPGDHSSSLSKVVTCLKEAEKHVGSGGDEGESEERKENRKGMLRDYVQSFDKGDVGKHVEGSRKWVMDKGPVVESYIGFIEDYVDPYGGRAEWEGLVAIVNKEQSAKYTKLVDRAEEFIAQLPWPKDYEVDVFKRPDFTSLEIVSFCTGGMPVGINIPNYFDIRESLGFKNVSLGNVLAAKAPNEKLTFVDKDEVGLFEEWDSKSFTLQVALHELLGHGTGKLFKEREDGTFNFRKGQVINPLTGKIVDTWYKPGESWSSRGGSVSSSFEEARAECVGLYLCLHKPILELFGYTNKEDQDNCVYINYLLMARGGIKALETYEPSTGKHGQAHMQARMGIAKWMIQHGLMEIEKIRDEKTGELKDLIVKLNKKNILEKGKDVMGKLLVEFQVRKSIGDGPGATEFYKDLTIPPEGFDNEMRDLVIKLRQPRKVFIQDNTFLVDGKVVLKEYPLTAEGLIQSYIEKPALEV